MLQEKEPASQGRECVIWAVGGGKGGTGKSFVTSCIGASLASKGKKVVLIDADLGGANLHSFLGVNRPGSSLTDFFDKKMPLADLIIDTAIPGMGLITGNLQSLASDDIKYVQKLKLFRHIKLLDADYVLIDLGAGSHFNTLDTFLLADKMIVVIVPEITAIENMYHFIKNVLFRKLTIVFKTHGLNDIAEDTWKKRETYGIKTFQELIEFLKGTSSDVKELLDRELEGFKIHFVLNNVKNNQEISIGQSVKSVSMKYLGILTNYAGYIEYDDCIRNCINNRIPFMRSYSSSRCAKEIEKLTENLITGKQVGMLRYPA